MPKLLVVFLALLLAGWPTAAGAQGIAIVLDGQELALPQEPILQNGRVLVPLRSVFENLGAQVQWQSAKSQVEVSKGNTRIYLPLKGGKARINGVSYELDVPPVIRGGRTYVPLRFISQALGAGVHWNSSLKRVEISSQGSSRKTHKWGFYVDSQSFLSLQNNPETLGAILPFSYTAQADGTVEERVFFAQGYELARTHQMPVYGVIVQTERGVLRELLGSGEKREKLVDSILEVVEKRQYQGVNLDLEGVAPEDRDNFTDLVRALKSKLAPKGLTLSVTVPAKIHDNFSWYKGYDYQALGQIADYLIVMAYDQHYSGSQPGPVAALDWVEQVVSYGVSQVPASKLILGLGIYGYDWPAGEKGRVVDLSQVAQLKTRGSEFWDDQAYSPYLTYMDEQGRQHQVWYEDPLSITGKLELVKKYQLAGIALWRLGIIPEPIWQALSSL